MRVHTKLVAVVIASLLFGILLAIVKGDDAGARDAFGNISAPWLLLPFAVGGWWRRPTESTLVGTLATFAALTGFYGAESVLLDLGPHSWIVDLVLTFQAGHIFFIQGALSGPVFGALGGLWFQRRSVPAGVAMALIVACEPAAVWLYRNQIGLSEDTGLLTHYPWMWLSEVALGLAGVAIVLTSAQVRMHRRPYGHS